VRFYETKPKMAPSIFQRPETLTEAEMLEAEAELKAMQHHALGAVDPEAET